MRGGQLIFFWEGHIAPPLPLARDSWVRLEEVEEDHLTAWMEALEEVDERRAVAPRTFRRSDKGHNHRHLVELLDELEEEVEEHLEELP